MSDAEVLALIDDLIESKEKFIAHSAHILVLRRRIRAAITLIDEGNFVEARKMLEAAKADDGAMLKRRLDKIAEQV